jgi:RNA polymerase sigma-70 factor (ECF subfamily)
MGEVSHREPGDIERVYREQSPRLWRAVLAWSGDAQIADDAVSEAFMQLLGRGAAVRDPQPWVWRAAFRIAAGDLKDRRKTDGAMPEHTVEMVEPALDLLQALQTLPPKQRAAIVLRYYAGYPTREVARMIGSSQPAVRMHLSAGRRRLRDLLPGEMFDDD